MWRFFLLLSSKADDPRGFLTLYFYVLLTLQFQCEQDKEPCGSLLGGMSSHHQPSLFQLSEGQSTIDYIVLSFALMVLVGPIVVMKPILWWNQTGLERQREAGL